MFFMTATALSESRRSFNDPTGKANRIPIRDVVSNLANQPKSTDATVGSRHVKFRNLLPDDRSELSQLCHISGLELACDVLKDKAPRSFLGHSAAATPVTDAELLPECLPPGRLVFVHVMKTGGLSVDSFLNCRCDSTQSCSVLHADGEVQQMGTERCSEPSVCTMHRGISNLNERCGFQFGRAARMVTVLRDPIERVWSFYNYLKRWYTPYQEMDLATIYKNLDTDLNENLPKGTHCLFCSGELTNAMTIRYFCKNPDLCSPLEGKKAPRRSVLAKALAEAKRALSAMDSIFLTQDLDYFDLMFDADRRLLPEWADADQRSCHASKVINHTPNKSSLDNRTIIKWISHKNRADILLYKYAWTLPKLWRLGPVGQPGEGTPWKDEFVETRSDKLMASLANSIVREAEDTPDMVVVNSQDYASL